MYEDDVVDVVILIGAILLKILIPEPCVFRILFAESRDASSAEFETVFTRNAAPPNLDVRVGVIAERFREIDLFFEAELMLNFSSSAKTS